VPVRRHGILNTGQEIGESAEMATPRQLIRHDSERPSHLNLPVVPTYSPWTGSAADGHPLDIGWYAVAIPVNTRSSTDDRFPLQLVNRNTGWNGCLARADCTFGESPMKLLHESCGFIIDGILPRFLLAQFLHVDEERVDVHNEEE
jgi:hypothetical protein